MKPLNLLIIIALFALSGCKEEEPKGFACNYYGKSNPSNIFDIVKTQTHQYATNAEAIKVIDQIVSRVGLARNFEVMPSDEVDNAAAVVIDEKRYILYNKEFMKKANEITNSSWASISILAHEIGHHLQGHTLTSTGSRPPIELEADKFSGFVLARMGATLQDAQTAIQNLVSDVESATHPKRSDRLNAIAAGFMEGVDKNKNSETPKTKIQVGVGSPIVTQPNEDVKIILPPSNSSPNSTSNGYALRTGKHSLTLQWISWEIPGSVTITKIGDNKYKIEGQQISQENSDYLKISGIIVPVSSKELSFEGTIRHRVAGNNGSQECVKTGRQTFLSTQGRKYWRMQDMTNCEGGLLTDYIDIYF